MTGRLCMCLILRGWLTGISSTCCDWSVMHVLYLACLVDWDRWYLLGSVGCAWAAVGIEWICAIAVLLLRFAFCVNYCGSIGSDGWYE